MHKSFSSLSRSRDGQSPVLPRCPEQGTSRSGGLPGTQSNGITRTWSKGIPGTCVAQCSCSRTLSPSN